MQIPILNGIFTDSDSDIRVAYPVNRVPTPIPSGISNGSLKAYDGIEEKSESSAGTSRGAIEWDGTHYRVIGSKLTSIDSDGVITELADVENDGLDVALDYSFDRLSIGSNKKLFYWDKITLTEVTDPDLGDSLDHIWVDGYFMSTDGENLVVTELNDPTSVNPAKYGSSEADPDPVVALLKLINEPYAINRFTMEVFENIGGSGFPFRRIEKAQIEKGSLGTHTCCKFLESIAFVGGGKEESISIFVVSNSVPTKIASREIDLQLKNYTENQLKNSLLESRFDIGHQFLLFHLPDKTLVYDHAASVRTGEKIWFILSSSPYADKIEQYRGRHLTWVNDKWWVGDSKTGKIGFLNSSEYSHWGVNVSWEFSTVIIFNNEMPNGILINYLELTGLTGRNSLSDNSNVLTSYSVDGEVWSTPKTKFFKRGERKKILRWYGQGMTKTWRIQRFQGVGSSMFTPLRLDMDIETLD